MRLDVDPLPQRRELNALREVAPAACEPREDGDEPRRETEQRRGPADQLLAVEVAEGCQPLQICRDLEELREDGHEDEGARRQRGGLALLAKVLQLLGRFRSGERSEKVAGVVAPPLRRVLVGGVGLRRPVGAVPGEALELDRVEVDAEVGVELDAGSLLVGPREPRPRHRLNDARVCRDAKRADKDARPSGERAKRGEQHQVGAVALGAVEPDGAHLAHRKRVLQKVPDSVRDAKDLKHRILVGPYSQARDLRRHRRNKPAAAEGHPREACMAFVPLLIHVFGMVTQRAAEASAHDIQSIAFTCEALCFSASMARKPRQKIRQESYRAKSSTAQCYKP
mmetsp:Transcript_33571/g.70638  ORF Transcript_33571/g.70638 Transcript_33571/m.70638 type:complete len:339 (-) Transcript_33571:331-1347(-)